MKAIRVLEFDKQTSKYDRWLEKFLVYARRMEFNTFHWGEEQFPENNADEISFVIISDKGENFRKQNSLIEKEYDETYERSANLERNYNMALGRCMSGIINMGRRHVGKIITT